MLKVLIADDEVIICKMLQKLLDWEELGFEIIGMAHNGLEVIEKISQLHPDVVITDIRMPGCDGLEIVRQGQETGNKIDFIIMSGYKNFEYAHTALNLGVKHYLLKPLEKKELEEILVRVRKEHLLMTEELKEKAALQEMARSGTDKIRKHFLNSIMEHSSFQQDTDLIQQEVTNSCEFVNGCFLVFFTKLDCEKPTENIKNLLDSIDYLIEKNVDSENCEFINSYIKSGVVTVLNYQEEEKASVYAMLARILKVCRIELDKFEGFHVTMGISSAKSNISEVQTAIDEAVSAVKCRLKKGMDKQIWFEELTYQSVPLEQILTTEDAIGLRHVVESLDFKAFFHEIQELEQTIHAVPNYHPALLFEVLSWIEDMMKEMWIENKINAELIQEFEEELQFVIDGTYKEELLMQKFYGVCENGFRNILDEKKSTGQAPVRLAKQYISRNFKDNITLEEVAEAIHLSPAYLSTLFRKEIGIKFSDYLTSCRMEEAKRLLKQTGDSMQQIAEECGYADSKYFSKSFHKMVGLKPSEYRKLYS